MDSKEGGLIKNNLLKIVSSILAAINVNETDSPVAITSVFSFITFFTKSVTNCTYI